MNLSEISTKELKEELEKRKVLKPTKSRYEITGEWSGYRSGQQRIVHREYTADKKYVDKIKNLGFICYTDGTTLNLKIRTMKTGERKQNTIDSYSRLIRDCIDANTNNVVDLRR
jgi:hypothetical protein